MNLEIIKKLNECNDVSCIFRIVKECVRHVLGRGRGGLMLALQELPSYVFAYYPYHSNVIVINKYVLRELSKALSPEEYKAYVFYVLLHEYLHSLGYHEEKKVYELSFKICREILGEEHLATLIAFYGPHKVIPELRDLIKRDIMHRRSLNYKIEIVKDFEKEIIYII